MRGIMEAGELSAPAGGKAWEKREWGLGGDGEEEEEVRGKERKWKERREEEKPRGERRKSGSEEVNNGERMRDNF
ncbi:hypothetical protein E2C01_050040 [Portunus trituberculatus]|uniref:Uncharacterized protein n=1 Tax=Portunus trituberculatus TaxID=210409 RepID=A0A5B7GG63_PORTR|nr:hypothetical protein [Portunus trituberculatus]